MVASVGCYMKSFSYITINGQINVYLRNHHHTVVLGEVNRIINVVLQKATTS